MRNLAMYITIIIIYNWVHKQENVIYEEELDQHFT